MSERQRPNLGGLFNGSTPPEQSSSISGAFGPRFLKQLPTEQQSGAATPEPGLTVGAVPSAGPASATETDEPAAQRDRRNALGCIDPVRIIEQYFAFLQAVLDTNRELAVALTSSVMSLPKRGRSH